MTEQEENFKKKVLETNINSRRGISGQQHQDAYLSSSSSYTGHQGFQTTNSKVINSKGENGLNNNNYQKNDIQPLITLNSQKQFNGTNVGKPQITEEELYKKFMVSGDTDFVLLKNMKDAMLSLIQEFQSQKFKFEGEFKQNIQKRLIALQHDFQGMMRRVVNVTYPGKRPLDFEKFMSDKEKYVKELEDKLAVLQQKEIPSNNIITRLEEENRILRSIINQRDNQISDLNRIINKNNHQYDANGKGSYDNIPSIIQNLKLQLDDLRSRDPSMEMLEQTISRWIIGLPGDSLLKNRLNQGTVRSKELDHYESLKEKLKYAADLYELEMKQHAETTGCNYSRKSKVLQILRSIGTKTIKVNINGYVVIEKEIRIEREITCPDENLKIMVAAFGMFIKKMIAKYPKLQGQMSAALIALINSELIDWTIQGDVQRIISIIKFVPEVVRVENIYVIRQQKHKRIEFHLRILIKALLDLFMKMKLQIGCHIDIDEAILILIRAQLIDIIDIDELLIIFRPIPKIIEVPKIVQKVVDTIVTIPEKYQMKETKTIPVPVKSVEVVRDEYGVVMRQEIPVPLIKEVPIIEKDIEQKIVTRQLRKDVYGQTVVFQEKVVPVEVMREKVCPVDRPITIKQEVLVQNPGQVIEIETRRNVPVELVTEVMVPVEFVRDKLVQRLETREIIRPVEVIHQVLRKVPEIHFIEKEIPVQIKVPYPVHLREEVIVQAIQTKQQIVSVDCITEKIVQMTNTIELPPKQIPIIQEKVIVQIVKEPFEIVKHEQVPVYTQVPVDCPRTIEVPVIHEIISVKPEVTEVPLLKEITQRIHFPVQIHKPEILIEERPVEVQRSVPHFLKEEIPVFLQNTTKVPVPYYYDRIKPEIQVVEKIIEKLVQVPRTVEVERIVEKIVIVPRIIQKIVEVPQIIEKIVEKIVQVPVQLPPIERIVERACIVEVPVEVPGPQRIVYLIKQEQVRVIEEVLRVNQQFVREQVPVYLKQQKIQVQTHQIPKQIRHEVNHYIRVEQPRIIEKDRIITIPEKIPVPIQFKKEVLVPYKQTYNNAIGVPQLVEKIVPQIMETVTIQTVPQIQQVMAVQQQGKPYAVPEYIIDKQIQTVQLMRQKLVEVETIIQEIKPVDLVFEKIVVMNRDHAKHVILPPEKQVEIVPGQVQIVQLIKPYIVSVNQYIDRIVEKLVEIPVMIRQCEPLRLYEQVAVPQHHEHHFARVEQVQVQKQFIQQVQKKVIDRVSRIEEVLKYATEIIERDRDPVIITRDRIIEVPYVIEKLVEQIIIKPHVHEVLKVVTECIEVDNLNVLVDVDIQIQFKQLTINLLREMDIFIAQLRKINIGGRSTIIQSYLASLKKYLIHPKFIQKQQKAKTIIEKQIIRIPDKKDPDHHKEELSRILLIEKLLKAFAEIKTHEAIDIRKYLDDDVLSLFGFAFIGTVAEVTRKLNKQISHHHHTHIWKIEIDHKTHNYDILCQQFLTVLLRLIFENKWQHSHILDQEIIVIFNLKQSNSIHFNESHMRAFKQLDIKSKHRILEKLRRSLFDCSTKHRIDLSRHLKPTSLSLLQIHVDIDITNSRHLSKEYLFKEMMGSILKISREKRINYNIYITNQEVLRMFKIEHGHATDLNQSMVLTFNNLPEHKKDFVINTLVEGINSPTDKQRSVLFSSYLPADVFSYISSRRTMIGPDSSIASSSQFMKFKKSVENKFSQLNGWSDQHNFMLKSFIEERFQLASVIKQFKEENQKLKDQNNDLKKNQETVRYMLQTALQTITKQINISNKIIDTLRQEGHPQIVEELRRLNLDFERLRKEYQQIFGARSSNLPDFTFTQEIKDKYINSTIRELHQKIWLLEEKLKTNQWRRDEHMQCDAIVDKLRMEICRLQSMLRKCKHKDHCYEADAMTPKGSIHTAFSPNSKKEKRDDSSRSNKSQVDKYGESASSYGNQFGEYIDNDPNSMGMIQSRAGRAGQTATYASIVEERDMRASEATYRSGHQYKYQQNFNSSRQIRNQGNGRYQRAQDSISNTNSNMNTEIRSSKFPGGLGPNDVHFTSSRVTMGETTIARPGTQNRQSETPRLPEPKQSRQSEGGAAATSNSKKYEHFYTRKYNQDGQ